MSPKSPKLAHFDQKNNVEVEFHQHEMAINKHESSKRSTKFIISKGFPLRYFTQMEASHEKPVMFVFKHECSNEIEAEGELTIQ